MDKGDDPYEILGIPYDATGLDAKKTFRKLTL
ncbi:MAG: preprotein translocase subunit Sec63 [Bacillariaceae sp.]|jgi:preprotein translocase subunit Sec63